LIFLIGYIAVKYAAYVTLCRSIPHFVEVQWGEKSANGFGYGLLRLFIGFVFGYVLVYIVAISAQNFGTAALDTFVMGYLILIPLRWLEWSLLLSIVQRKLVFGQTAGQRKWLTLGVLVSCVLDLGLVLVADNVKFFC